MPHETIHPMRRTRISNSQNHVGQGSNLYAHRPCQVHPPTSYSSSSSPNETESEDSHGHHSSCPRFRSQEARLPPRMSRTRTTASTPHGRDTLERSHSVQSEPRHHPCPGGNNRPVHASIYRHHKEPFVHTTVEATPSFEGCHAHPRAISMKPRSFAYTTAQGSQSEVEGNVKSVRFSDEEDSVHEDRSPPSICPVHHRRSSDGRRYGLYGNILPLTTRASRTYKWVWGPPLPEGFRDGYRG